MTLTTTVLNRVIEKYVKGKTERVLACLDKLAPTDDDEKVCALYDVLCYGSRAPQLLFQGQCLFHHKAFDECHMRVQQEEQILQHPVAVEEGALSCRFCRSTKTFSYTKQTRRSDEGATVFVQCAECRRQFRL
jgi:hypothetical protein